MSDTAPMEQAAGLAPPEESDPLQLLEAWLAEAARSEPADPTAMALATVDAAGMPDVRMVLMKGLDSRGLVFYTNVDSQKGRQLASQPKAALAFHWKSLARQVRLRGPVERVSDAEADAYFATRPRLAQIGAWASQQSAPLESRLALEQRVALLTSKYAFATIPRPRHWSGFRCVPLSLEFWRERPFRLHERVRFTRSKVGHPWHKSLLYP